VADGQIVRFKIGEAFPADDQLARWMTVCAMAINDLLLVNRWLVPKLKDEVPSEPGEIFYLGRLAAANLFEAATFLRKSDRQLAPVKEFVATLGEEGQEAYQDLLLIGDGGEGEFYERLKHARNGVFHYQALVLGEGEDFESLKRAMNAHAEHENENEIEGGEIQDLPPAITGFRANFADDIAAEMMLPESTEEEFPSFIGNVSEHSAKLMIFVRAALNKYTHLHPGAWEIEDVRSEEGNQS
jgi:hypothetical protein